MTSQPQDITLEPLEIHALEDDAELAQLICKHLRKARRHHGTTPPILMIAAHDPKRSRLEQTREFDSLRMNRTTRQANLQDHPLTLTAREFELLWHFLGHPGRVFSRAELLDQVWGIHYKGYEHTVNSHINRLRAKLHKIAPSNKLIHTLWGVGYRLGVDAPESI